MIESGANDLRDPGGSVEKLAGKTEEKLVDRKKQAGIMTQRVTGGGIISHNRRENHSQANWT